MVLNLRNITWSQIYTFTNKYFCGGFIVFNMKLTRSIFEGAHCSLGGDQQLKSSFFYDYIFHYFGNKKATKRPTNLAKSLTIWTKLKF